MCALCDALGWLNGMGPCLQVVGIINSIIGLITLMMPHGSLGTGWIAPILCLAIGIPATLASLMYNPFGCLWEYGTGSLRLKKIVIVCIMAAAAAFAAAIYCAAFMVHIPNWPAPKRYVCCPADASKLTSDSCLTESNEYGEKDCIRPDGYSPHDFDCVTVGP